MRPNCEESEETAECFLEQRQHFQETAGTTRQSKTSARNVAFPTLSSLFLAPTDSRPREPGIDSFVMSDLSVRAACNLAAM